MKPTDRSAVLTQAANILQTNGLHHGDYVVDPFNRHLDTPHHLRPMSVVGAINCAVTDNPRIHSNLSWSAITALAGAVLVGGEPALSSSLDDQERHVDAWSDCVTVDYAVKMLLVLAGRESRQAVAA